MVTSGVLWFGGDILAQLLERRLDGDGGATAISGALMPLLLLLLLLVVQSVRLPALLQMWPRWIGTGHGYRPFTRH